MLLPKYTERRSGSIKKGCMEYQEDIHNKKQSQIHKIENAKIRWQPAAADHQQHADQIYIRVERCWSTFFVFLICLLILLFALLACLLVCLLVCLFACLLVCLFAWMLVCLFACLFHFLLACLPSWVPTDDTTDQASIGILLLAALRNCVLRRRPDIAKAFTVRTTLACRHHKGSGSKV